jgi:RNA polymerase sigma-70 factor (ECF subfamily)
VPAARPSDGWGAPRLKAVRLAAILLRTQPDAQLVALSRGGGAAAFEEIARRHGPALTGFAASVAPASQADDVVQDSLLKAYTALSDGAQPEILTAWLFRIVRNTAIDAQRATRSHAELDESHDGVEQPPQAFERKAQIAALAAAINELPRSQREAIVQRELEGRGHEEIARSLGQSAGAVRQLIYRARNSLRESMGGLIPPALVRLATMPGANEAVGGTGLAAAVKLGLAAIVATGTIVAGSSIDRGASPPIAQAHQLEQGGNGSADARVNATGDSPAGSESRKAHPVDGQTGHSAPPGTPTGNQPSTPDTSGGGSGQGGDSGSGSGGDGSGSQSGSGEHETGTGSEPGSEPIPSEPEGPGGGTEPANPGGDDTSTEPPPSSPPGDGGDGARI